MLGQRYGEAGVEEGERAIRALCRHPSTAQFVATKLVTHFVSDEPPAAAVDRVARVFRSSDGDLKAVARALVDEPEAWREDARKFRTPQDWFVAVLRALRRQRREPERAGRSASAAAAGLVAGGAEGIRRRACRNGPIPTRCSIAASWRARSRKLPAMRALDPQSLAGRRGRAGGNPLHALLADTSIAAPERIALAVAGPAFQWR